MHNDLINMTNNRDLPVISVSNGCVILVSIIVINRNGIHHLKTLIPALLKYTSDINYELILVDNASSDDSIDYVKKTIANFSPVPGLKIIENLINESFSVANNRAVSQAKGEYLVLLNNDIEPLPGWLHFLLRDAQRIKNIGSVGSRLVYPETAYSLLDSLLIKAKKKENISYQIQHAGIAFKNEHKLFRPYNLGKGKPFNHPDVIKSGTRSALTAACLLVPRSVYDEVGGLDESYHYGGEDVDFGLKLLKSGYVNYYCADSVLFHHEFGTQDKEQKECAARRRQKNLLTFQGKWFIPINKAYWSEKIAAKSNLFSEHPLTIAIPESQKNSFREVVTQIKAMGWRPVFLSKKVLNNKDAYDLILSSKQNRLKAYNNNLSVLLEGNWCEKLKHQLTQCYIKPSIVIKIAAKKWKDVYSWGDYHMAVSLKQEFEKKGYRVLLQIFPEWDNDEGLEYDVAIVFRGLRYYQTKPQQVNIMWNISHPDMLSLEEYEAYDKVFIASEYWAKKIAEQVSTPVEPLLQCTDPERFHEPGDKERQIHRKQLLFVGNSRDVFRKVLKDLLPTEFDLAVYGKNWKKLIPKKYFKSEHIPNNELYKYYGSADILLNDHWDDMREKGFVSNRIFDALACGAFVITDKVNAIGELSEYVQVYETKEALNSLIDYYLAHPDKRNEKALKGMAFVQNQHTFKERADCFLETINILMQQRVGEGFQFDKPDSKEV